MKKENEKIPKEEDLKKTSTKKTNKLLEKIYEREKIKRTKK